MVEGADERLKENIEDIEYGVEKIMDLRPVSFEWKKDENNTRKLGLIAQEVEPELPEVVNVPKTEDETYGINYSGLVPVLIKAIQEQQVRIEGQNAKIQSLLKRIEALEEQGQL
ncbi:MAG: tail fiber domain-containing protein [bacterium]|nr:tail fiber domain-containing protein [bacterium]